jgi:nitrogen fixation protein NifX
VVQSEALPREVALRIGAAARELPGVPLRVVVRVLIELTEDQLTLEGFERVGPRVLRDELRKHAPTRSADAHRAVQALRRKNLWLRHDTPLPGPLRPPPEQGWLRVAFTSNEGQWLDASLSGCRRVLVYWVSSDDAAFLEVRRGDGTADGPDRAERRVALLSDCHILYTLFVGAPAMAALVRQGVHTVKMYQAVPCMNVVQRLQNVMRQTPPPWMRKVLQPSCGDAAEALVQGGDSVRRL